MMLVNSNTLKALTFPAELKEDLSQFLADNGELLTGFPADWLAQVFDSSALADEEYADQFVEIYRAMSPEERRQVLARNLKTLANSKSLLQRRVVLMERARTFLSTAGRKALSAVFAAL